MATTNKKAAKKAPAAAVKQSGADAAIQSFNDAVRALDAAGKGLIQAGRRSKTFGTRADVKAAFAAAQKTLRKLKNEVVKVPDTTTIAP